MKKLNNNYVAPQVEWVELFAENEVMASTGAGSVTTTGGSWS